MLQVAEATAVEAVSVATTTEITVRPEALAQAAGALQEAEITLSEAVVAGVAIPSLLAGVTAVVQTTLLGGDFRRTRVRILRFLL